MSPNPERFAVRVDPGELHFNAAHFITFGGTCENLHGHNFHVRVEAVGRNTGDAFVLDFVELTRLAAAICRTLHDRVLLPGESREVTITPEGDALRVESHGRRFVLPADSCRVLPVSNATAEMLAWHIGGELIRALREAGSNRGLETLEVAVEEADRQWGVCRREVAP